MSKTIKKIVKKKPLEKELNRFGIQNWTGEDVEKFRKEFAPPGKEKMSYDELASLLGLNYRSQPKRYAEQKELQAIPSLAFEFIKRLLTEERSGGNSRKHNFTNLTEIKTETTFGTDFISIKIIQQTDALRALVIRLTFGDSQILSVEESHGEEIILLHQIKLS